MSMIHTLIGMASVFQSITDTNTEHLKQQAIDKYKKALTLPRKQKKRMKKEAQLDYSIACWNPFE